MRHYIDIDEAEVSKQINEILNEIFIREIRRRGSDTREVMDEFVKNCVYAHKDEIIERIIDRSVAELVRKGLPKLMERMVDQCQT